MSASKFEQTLNHVIANGADIEEKLSGLGCVWATKSELARFERHEDNEAKKAEKLADKKYKGLKKAVALCGEVRYYKTSSLYATVKGNWFELRKDGYFYAIPKAKRAQMGLA